MDYKRIREYTAKHMDDPQPGDHFTEMCGSVAYIEARDGDNLTVLRTKVKDGQPCWGEPEQMTIAEFKRWASYDGIPGYWLELIPPIMPAEMLVGG